MVVDGLQDGERDFIHIRQRCLTGKDIWGKDALRLFPIRRQKHLLLGIAIVNGDFHVHHLYFLLLTLPAG